MLIGAGVSAIGAYVFLVNGTRAFDEVAFAPIALAWTILFLGATIFFLPLEQLMIREVSRGPSPRQVMRTHAGVIAAGVLVPVVVGGVYTAMNLEDRFDGNAWFIAVVMLMLALVGIYFVGRGSLAGQERFRAYGNAVMADAVVRVLLGLAALAVAMTVLSYAVALVLTPLIIWFWKPFSVETSSPHSGLPVENFFGGLVIAQGASQMVLAGGPIVVAALGAGSMADDELNAIVSTFFVTFTLIRGPLTATYNLTARILPALTETHESGGAPQLARWLQRAAVSGLVGAPVLGWFAYVFGPWAVAALYGVGYDPHPLMTAYAAAGIGLGIAVLVMTQILIAQARTVALAKAWVAALAVGGVYVLMRAGSPEMVVSEAFVVSHLVALIGVWWAGRGAADVRVPAFQ